jgi:hypothetical protein
VVFFRFQNCSDSFDSVVLLIFHFNITIIFQIQIKLFILVLHHVIYYLFYNKH